MWWRKGRLLYICLAVTESDRTQLDIARSVVEMIDSEFRIPVATRHLTEYDNPYEYWAKMTGKPADQVDPRLIERTDTGWLEEATELISFVTDPSIGVGVEIGQVIGKNLHQPFWRRKIPILSLYNENRRISPMILGKTPDRYPFMTVQGYLDAKQAREYVRSFLCR